MQPGNGEEKPGRKIPGGILGAVVLLVAAIVAYQAYKGLTVQEIGIPGVLSIKWGEPPKQNETAPQVPSSVATTKRQNSNVTLRRYIDLDDGSTFSQAVENSGEDLELVKESASTYRIVPTANAQIATVEGRRPSYAQCAAAKRSGRSILVSELHEGTYLCVRTDQGRNSAVQLNDSDIENGINISYITWCRASNSSPPDPKRC